MAYENKPLKQSAITIESYGIKVYQDGGQQYDLKTNLGKFKFSAATKEGKKRRQCRHSENSVSVMEEQ